jgi:phospholipid/cholesterol/gamma-HCH transport system permease protein
MPELPPAPREQASPGPRISLQRTGDGTLWIDLSGRWRLQEHLAASAEVEGQLDTEPRPARVAFRSSALDEWDSSLLTLLGRIGARCEQYGIATDRGGLPAGVRRLLDLAAAVPEKKGARREAARPAFLERVGAATLALGDAASEVLAFVGRFTLAAANLLRGRTNYRRADLFVIIQQCGAQALPIVSLVSFLVGTILAFVGAVQLQKFGASIYVADLVGIGIARDMGAMMTAIVMAGRTGAAFAAEIGTMKVNREVDALSTMGISPVEFLVLPRMMALFLMMPFLCLYSIFLGILGGAAVGVGMLGLTPMMYYQQTVSAVGLGDVAGGVFKASVYGVLVAVSGCMRGMQCGSSSQAVGAAATSAVVTSIVLIVSACGLFAVVFYILGI